MDFQQWLGTGVPPVTVRGLDHRTEDYSLHPLQHKAGTIPLLNSPEQDKPRGWRDQPPTKPKYIRDI